MNIKKCKDLLKIYILKNKIIKKNYGINIIILSKKEIKILNKKYRKVNKETDILTFSNDIQINLLGDIILCMEVIENTYINKTLIHGILHLLEYNHIQLTDAKIMHQVENKIGMSGIEPPTITTSK